LSPSTKDTNPPPSFHAAKGQEKLTVKTRPASCPPSPPSRAPRHSPCRCARGTAGRQSWAGWCRSGRWCGSARWATRRGWAARRRGVLERSAVSGGLFTIFFVISVQKEGKKKLGRAGGGGFCIVGFAR